MSDQFDRGTVSTKTGDRLTDARLAAANPVSPAVTPDISQLFRTLAYFRTTLSPTGFHQLMGRHETRLFPILRPFGYYGSYARPDLTITHFDRAYRAWSRIAESAPEGAAVGPAVIEDRAAQEMWRTASGDPVAAAIIVMGYLISKLVTERFGYELDPGPTAANAQFVSHGVHALGGAGVNQLTRDKGDRRPRGRPGGSGSRPQSGRPPRSRAAPGSQLARQRAVIDEAAEVRRIKSDPSFKADKKLWDEAKKDLDSQEFLAIRPEDVRAKVDIGKMRGSYEKDFAAADRLAGFIPDLPGKPGTGNRPRDLVWHHSENLGLMYLIPKVVHSAGGGRNLDHQGGSAVWKKIYGMPYPFW